MGGIRHALFVLVAVLLGTVKAHPIAVIAPADEPRTMNAIMEGLVALDAGQDCPLVVTAATNRARARVHVTRRLCATTVE